MIFSWQWIRSTTHTHTHTQISDSTFSENENFSQLSRSTLRCCTLQTMFFLVISSQAAPVGDVVGNALKWKTSHCQCCRFCFDASGSLHIPFREQFLWIFFRSSFALLNFRNQKRHTKRRIISCLQVLLRSHSIDSKRWQMAQNTATLFALRFLSKSFSLVHNWLYDLIKATFNRRSQVLANWGDRAERLFLPSKWL